MTTRQGTYYRHSPLYEHPWVWNPRARLWRSKSRKPHSTGTDTGCRKYQSTSAKKAPTSADPLSGRLLLDHFRRPAAVIHINPAKDPISDTCSCTLKKKTLLRLADRLTHSFSYRIIAKAKISLPPWWKQTPMIGCRALWIFHSKHLIFWFICRFSSITSAPSLLLRMCCDR